MRVESYEIELRNKYGVSLGTLDNVEDGGRLTGNVNSDIRWSGELTYYGHDIGLYDWLGLRLCPKITVNGLTSPLGVYLVRPSAPVIDSTGTSMKLSLYDKTFIPANDAVEDTYSLPAGILITDAVRTLLESSGEAMIPLNGSDATLSSSMAWDAGTTKLRIINDLLGGVGFFSLWCDYNGVYRIEPYQKPSARPIAYTFMPSHDAIHTSRAEYAIDSAIPNKIICLSQETGDTPVLRAVSVNEDPASPYSFQNQGAWITETHTGIEAASQDVLDAKARQLLANAVSSTTVTRSMAVTPLELNSTVISETGREVVENIDITLQAGTLMKIVTREVA